MEAKYQWLPTLFRVSNNGTVSAASYITNLNGSRYPEMVSGIERALSACLPLLEEVLTELRRDGARSTCAQLIQQPQWTCTRCGRSGRLISNAHVAKKGSIC